MPVTESTLVAYAREELQRAGLLDQDSDYSAQLGKHVLDLVQAFSEGRHSGESAEMTIQLLEKLLRFHPLTPLTYEPDEWIDQTEISGTPLWQNRRKSDVFSTDGGTTWYCLDGSTSESPAPSDPTDRITELEMEVGGAMSEPRITKYAPLSFRWHRRRHSGHGQTVNRRISTPGWDLGARGTLWRCSCGRTWAK